MHSTTEERVDARLTAPFDTGRLDALLKRDGIDVVVATSRHNVRYLLGSYSAFHESFDAIGVDRYLPAVGYLRGRPAEAFAIGADVDAAQHEVEPLWVPTVVDASQSAVETARQVAGRLRALGHGAATVGIERSFAPWTFLEELKAQLPGLQIREVGSSLEELRAQKRPEELRLIREAAELIVESIVATVRSAAAGVTKRELVDRLRVEEERRGLRFEYCLIAAGASMNRAASEQRWQPGEVLSVDSGGQRCGYIGDLCRMAVLGPPSPELCAALVDVRAIQDAARRPIRAGAIGAAIYAAAAAERNRCTHIGQVAFVAHGMGIVPHEAPRLSDSAPIRYPATHRDQPLQAGMVLSIETDARMEGIGLIKLEDTVVVTENGWEAYGDSDRDWIVVEP